MQSLALLSTESSWTVIPAGAHELLVIVSSPATPSNRQEINRESASLHLDDKRAVIRSTA